MFTVLSPAKRLHEGPAIADLPHTTPDWLDESATLIDRLHTLSEEDLTGLMSISPTLASLNKQRYADWSSTSDAQTSRQAALTFAGDTYVGLDASSLDGEDLEYAQRCLGILSGLHGLLRPLDLVQPYRLEMGTKLPNGRGKNLYEFWGNRIGDRVSSNLADHPHKVVINLASNEYFKAMGGKSFQHRIVTPIFKEVKAGKAKVVSFVAKRARGTMARHIVRHRIEDPEALKAFQGMGYQYQPEQSTDNDWVFTRPSGTQA